ncbi:MAG: hypothetical protein M3299_06205, partial [Thermoproteota archaeon]|nr:hypothetical protein [Thermoproteota archaeon]
MYSPPLLTSPGMRTALITIAVATATIIAVIFLASNFTIAHAQELPLEEEDEEDEEQQQVQSDGEEGGGGEGGLAATLNGESFTRGDTITVSGTVEEREPNS